MNKIYHILFPGLNLSFEISPVAFQFGSVKIYWYGILICLGFLLALFYCLKRSKDFKITQDQLIDAVIVGAIFAVVGARIYYVVFYKGDMFIKNPVEIFRINEGGIAIYGGLIGAILGGLIVAKIKKIKFLNLLDLSSMGFLIGQTIGRWGNFTNQEAFGTQTDSIFRMVSEGTHLESVHPCFLYESFWCALGFLLIHFFNLKFKKYDGQLFLMYVFWYGLGRFFIEALRTDSLFIPNTSIRISQLVAILSALTALVLLIYNEIKLKNLSKEKRGEKFGLSKGSNKKL